MSGARRPPRDPPAIPFSRAGLRALGVAALALALIATTACGGEDEPAAADSAPAATQIEGAISIGPDEALVIGVSTALTGPVGERGTEYRDAVLLGVDQWRSANGDEVLGHPIEVHSEDDGCTEADQTAVAAGRLLSTQGLVGVIGPQCSAGASAVLPTYAEAKVVSISGSATATALTTEQPEDGYFFRTAFRNDLQGNVAGNFVATTLGAKTVFLVDNGGTYGLDLAASTERFLSGAGVKVTRATAPQRTVDFSELATRVAALNPDAVGYAGFNPDAALFFRQLRDADYRGDFGSFDAAASASEFVAPLGETAEGAYFAGCALELPDDFRSAFSDIHGSPPSAAFNGQYADAVRAMLDAVAASGQQKADGALTVDRAQLRDAVRKIAISDGHTGTISFDAKGDRSSARTDAGDQAADFGLVGCRVEDSQLVQIQGQ